MDGFEIGDGVTTVDGPMKGVYGTVVWFYEEKQQLLVVDDLGDSMAAVQVSFFFFYKSLI